MRCEQKQKFATASEAAAVACKLRAGGVSRISVYQCHHCGHWHVGKRSRGTKWKDRRGRG